MSNSNIGTQTPPAPAVELSPMELKVFVAYLLGWPHWRIALQCGIGEGTVAGIIARPRFQAAHAAATSQVIAQGAKIATRFAELAPEAVERVAYLMHNAKHENVQMRSAFDILDRAGYRPTERVEHTNADRKSASFNLSALSDTERDSMRLLAEKAARASMFGTAGSSELNATIDIEPNIGFTSTERPGLGGAGGDDEEPPTPGKTVVEL